jgi:Carbamoyl-phosphate synthase L chain, ATP binding domain
LKPVILPGNSLIVNTIDLILMKKFAQKKQHNNGKSRVLLISYKNWDSLMEMPALLHQGGCLVDVFCTEGAWVLKNRYYHQSVIAENDPELFMQQLLDFIHDYGDQYQWVIPGDDDILSMLNQHIKGEHLFYKLMPLSKIENRKMLGSKIGFAEVCAQYMIKAPRYLVYRDGMTHEEIRQAVGYPLMVKVDLSAGGFGIYRCENERDLAATLSGISSQQRLLLQEVIEGYEVNTELLCKNGELVVYNHSTRVKTMGQFGVSTKRAFSTNPRLAPMLAAISKDLGLSGFCNMVFMYRPTTDEYFLIEADPRPNSWMYYGRLCGSDFSQGVRRIMSGDLHLLPQPSQEGKEMNVSLFKKDMYRCITEKDFAGIKDWLLNVDNRWRYLPLDDLYNLGSCVMFLLQTFVSLAYHKLCNKVGIGTRMSPAGSARKVALRPAAAFADPSVTAKAA